MNWTRDIQQFVTEHLLDDTVRLLLSAHRYPDVDMTFVVEQIEARRRLKNKLPEWYSNPSLLMGGRIPAEQCSSELTARFKRSVMIEDARSLCDMTGGMGVDFWYMSQGLDRAVYTERQAHLCEAARHNFVALAEAADTVGEGLGPAREIVVREGLSTDLPVPDVDVIYLDPARRSQDGSRIFEISDCEPDVVGWQEELLSHCRQLITKVSPMADIKRTLSRLQHVSDVYVLSVRNECKELLIVQQIQPLDKEVMIHCVDFLADRVVDFSYGLEEAVALISNRLASQVRRYFYEPDVSIMKAMGFTAIASRFNVEMLDADCHYFTSDDWIPEFPGRSFAVDALLDCSSRGLKSLRKAIPQANIAARGFLMSADQLRQRTGIRDGGEVYLFGAMLHDQGPVLLRCHKINPLSYVPD